MQLDAAPNSKAYCNFLKSMPENIKIKPWSASGKFLQRRGANESDTVTELNILLMTIFKSTVTNSKSKWNKEIDGDEKMVDWKDIRSGVVHVVMQHSDDWFGNASRANLRKIKIMMKFRWWSQKLETLTSAIFNFLKIALWNIFLSNLESSSENLHGNLKSGSDLSKPPKRYFGTFP